MKSITIAAALLSLQTTAAFSPIGKLLTPVHTTRTPHSSYSHLYSQNDNASDAIGGDLVTALSRLNNEWELTKSRPGGGNKIGEWSILDVSTDDDDNDTPNIVYLLEPASGTNPSCLIFFLGGAVLGQFPHIAYSSFLSRLATKMNASVVAIPYEVNLDHYTIAQQCVQRMKGSIIECEDKRGYVESLPKFAIGHSLGAKLHCIGMAATGIGEELAGVGLISYNNFGFAETIRMSRNFAKQLNVGGVAGAAAGAASSMPLDAIIDLAEMAVSAVGLEFTPSPTEMDKILTAKFHKDVLLAKTRMFVFDDDELDSCKSFLECFDEGPAVSYLPGTHLTPVYLKLGVDDLPDEARDVASAVTGGFQNASFGDEEALEALVDEVSDWMLGKNASGRRPNEKRVAGLIDAEIEK